MVRADLNASDELADHGEEDGEEDLEKLVTVVAPVERGGP
jgi:hypothetical protein